MAMTRSDATTYLTGQLRSALIEVGLDVVGDPALDVTAAEALEPVIDDALLMIGMSASDLATATVSDAQVFGYRRVLRYVGLQFVYDQALSRVDISVSDPDVRKSRSQFATALKDALASAKSMAEPFITAESSFQTGVIGWGGPAVTNEFGGWPSCPS